MDEASIFLAKAEASLAGAESELQQGRFDNCANRSHYASFQAAVAALIQAGIRPRVVMVAGGTISCKLGSLGISSIVGRCTLVNSGKRWNVYTWFGNLLITRVPTSQRLRLNV